MFTTSSIALWAVMFLQKGASRCIWLRICPPLHAMLDVSACKIVIIGSQTLRSEQQAMLSLSSSQVQMPSLALWQLQIVVLSQRCVSR